LKLFELFATLKFDGSEFEKGLKASEKSADDFGKNTGKSLKDVLKVAGGVAAAATAVGAAVLGMANSSSQAADKVDKGSQKLGISAKYYQQLNYALGLSGASIDTFSKAYANLNDVAEDSEVDKALKSIGIDASTYGDTETMMRDIISAISDMEDLGARSSVMETIFGSMNAASLNAFFNAGRQGIEDMYKEAEDLGLIMSDEAVKEGAAYQDAQSKLSQATTALKNALV